MYITCPSCSTSYEVDGTSIGHQGRAVRCFNCHHTWHQYPVAAPPPMRPVQPAPQISARYVPQSAQGYRASAYGEPAYAGASAHAYAAQPAYAMPPAAYAPPPMPEPEPAPMPRPAPVRAAPPPPPPQPKAAPKPAPKPMPVEPVPSDDELDDMLGPNKGDAASRAFGAPSRDDTPALDEDAIAKLPDPEPMRQFSNTDDDDDDFDDDIEPDDIPDPDPIPGVFGDDDEDGEIEEKGSGLKKLIAPAITIIAIGAVIAGLVVGRPYIVALWPAANDYIYDLIGLHVAVPGDGLERKITRTAVETIANVDHVIATGFVTNTSDKEQPLPLVLVQLLDAKVQVLDTKTVKLDKTSLQAGETLQFKAVFEGAPATARTVRVEWGKFAEAMAP